jgi:hypothetical protein
MKAWHYLQASSEIIGRHRYRPDVTGTTTLPHPCRLGRESGKRNWSLQPDRADCLSGCAGTRGQRMHPRYFASRIRVPGQTSSRGELGQHHVDSLGNLA